MERFPIAVLASGGGTNLQAIIDAIERNELDARIVCVVSNVPDAYALERARKAGIEAVCIPHKGKDREQHDEEVAARLRSSGARLVVLAGYLRMLTRRFFDLLGDIPLINIHPALLPSFGGAGFHGGHVHKAVLDHGCKVSGCTVHFVTPEVDAGPIILQHAVEVKEDDTSESLGKRVLEWEHRLLPRAIQLIAEGRLRIEGRRVRIEDRG